MATTAGMGLDDGSVAPGVAEELAGPPHIALNPLQPVSRAERISSMDVLRGFSLMGILVMNITDFAYGYTNYAFPLSTVKPVFDGPDWKINTAAWFMRWIFAEGKMRALVLHALWGGRNPADPAGTGSRRRHTRSRYLHPAQHVAGGLRHAARLPHLERRHPLLLRPGRTPLSLSLSQCARPKADVGGRDPAGHQQRPGGQSRSTRFGLGPETEQPRPTPSSRNTSHSPKTIRTP